MKGLLIAIVVLAGIQNTAFAQDNDSRELLSLGAKAGINYSNVWDESGGDFIANPKFGFVGGGFIGIPIGRFFGIQPEVLFSQKGFEANGTILGSPYTYTRTSSFIDVPLQVQLKPTRFLTLLAGPQYSYLLRENNKVITESSSQEQENEFDDRNLRKNILGVVAGLDIHTTSFVISGRVCWDLQDNRGDGTSSSPRYRNQWAQLTLGIRF